MAVAKPVRFPIVSLKTFGSNWLFLQHLDNIDLPPVIKGNTRKNVDPTKRVGAYAYPYRESGREVALLLIYKI